MESIYLDKVSGEKVRIVNEDGNFFTLDNNVRVKKDIFYKKYEDFHEIDPNYFFKNNTLFEIADKIKNFDTSKIGDENDSGVKIKYNPPVVISDSSDPTIKNKPQVEETIKLTPDEKRAMLEEWKRTQPGAQIPSIQNQVDDYDDNDEIVTENLKKDDNKEKSKIEKKEDPLELMFKMFKNNYLVKLNVEIEEYIPNPAFIGMVQSNVEADAIEYYANMISNKMVKNIEIVKEKIYKQLKDIVEPNAEDMSKDEKNE